MRTNRKWSAEEEQYLVSQVKAYPQNLKACFVIVADKTGRSIQGVASHWYTKTSKEPANLCFMTIGRKHRSMNRKNDAGEKSTPGIFERLIKMIGL